MPKIKVLCQAVQTGELGQTDMNTHKRTDGRYQVHYLPALQSTMIIVPNFSLAFGATFSFNVLDGYKNFLAFSFNVLDGYKNFLAMYFFLIPLFYLLPPPGINN